MEKLFVCVLITLLLLVGLKVISCGYDADSLQFDFNICVKKMISRAVNISPKIERKWVSNSFINQLIN